MPGLVAAAHRRHHTFLVANGSDRLLRLSTSANVHQEMGGGTKEVHGVFDHLIVVGTVR